MASAWKNVEPRRVHRERSQPKARAKLGLLEKKKDYKERAQAFHRKKDRLRALQLKAAFRNPDEFNFKMVRTQTKVRGGGSHYLYTKVQHWAGGVISRHWTCVGVVLLCRLEGTDSLTHWES